MKNILIITLIISFFMGQGQPTITSSSFPTIGTVTTHATFNATNISEGSTGPNQIWNFNVTPGLSLGTMTFVHPSSTPYFSSYPGANIAIQNTQGTVITYNYFNHNSNYTERLGGVHNLGSHTQEFIYSDAAIYLYYPSTYNSTFTDSFAGSVSTVSQGGGLLRTSSGSITVTADAYGILTTPLGTFNNTLRFKIEGITYDTSIFFNSPTPPEYLYVKGTTYSWIDQTENYSLFNIYYDTIIGSNNPGPTYSKFGIYQTGISTDINEINLKNVISFPNPVKEFTKIDASQMKSGEVLLQIFDVTGKLIKSQTVLLGNTSSKYLVVETEEFSNGLYYLNLIQDKYRLSSKFIKQ